MKKSLIIFLSGIVAGFILCFIFEKFAENKTANEHLTEISNAAPQTNITNQISDLQEVNSTKNSDNSLSIDELTAEKRVVAFVKKNGHLPECYISKNEARNLGWEASAGNLCDVLPGRAIGGDYFSNREKSLPAKNGRKYFEADVNYRCGNRGADRLVFSNDGLVFITHNHYKTFEQQ
ncbi:hypothetical protein FACS189429_5640 [Bacteroidia bacterium]|nr:hypothetical protein FACS189429_5640 [Bacteroidia bacterium]GHV43289.1 hypothetical protein FACS1894180_1920 [Bacteroidia bacterium]